MGPSVFVSSYALEQNLRLLMTQAPRHKAFPVLKANAYGHDAVAVAKLLSQKFTSGEVPMFCVARSSEAAAILPLGLPQDLLVLSYVDWDWHLQNPSDRVVIAMASLEDLQTWRARARGVAALSRVHLKINTGMNRLGLTLDDLAEALPLLKTCVTEGLRIEGVLSHFWNSDGDTDEACREQLEMFLRALRELSQENLIGRDTWIHVENSAALRWHLEIPAEGRMAFRPGIHLWGYGADKKYSDHDDTSATLLPALAVAAPIRQLKTLPAGEGLSYGWRFRAEERDVSVATVPLGYADGIPRRLSWDGHGKPKGYLVVDGVKCPIISTVTMDMVMIVIDDSLHDKIRQRAQVFAYWIHPDHQSVYDIADTLSTITYEVLCRLSSRVPRRMVENFGGLP